MEGRRSGHPAAPWPQRDDQPCVTLREHLEILRAADQRFGDERDRRYTAVARERDKAQHARMRADERALQLARDIQNYRDEQANRLREQISSERGLYITKTEHEALIARVDALVKPLAEFVAAQRGRLLGEERSNATASDLAGRLIAVLSLLVSVAVAAFIIVHGK